MSSKKSLGLIVIIFGFILIALTGIRTISNPEIFTHIALGQADGAISYTMDNQQWINLNPLYNKVAATLWAMGGAPAITLAHTALLLAALVLLFRLGKNWGGPVSQGLALLLCSWLLLPVFNPGPVIFALLFAALFVTLLHRMKNFIGMAAALLVLQVLWTNIHPSFLFGPVLILFFAIENLQASRTASRTTMAAPQATRLFGLAAGALLITLANPNFFKLHTHIFANWFMLIRADCPEWVSLFSGGFPHTFTEGLYFFTLILCAGGLVTLQKKLPPTLTGLALTGAALGVLSFSRGDHSIRALLAYSLLVFPFMILSLNAISEYLSHSLVSVVRVSEKLLQSVMVVITLILMLATAGAIVTNNAYVGQGSASSFGLGVAEESFPVAAASLLDRNDFPEKILNIAHDGGYLATQHPDRKVYCDSRLSFYGSDFYQQLDRALLGQKDDWDAVMRDWTPDAVVLNGAWPDAGALARRLGASKVWKLVYFDGSTVILVRDLPDFKSLIDYALTEEPGQKILNESLKKYKNGNKTLFKSGNSPRLIGGAGILLSLNRPQDAEMLYRTITRNCPNMATAWLGLGQSLIYQKKMTEGIENMEQAARILPNSSRIWMGLYRAYRMKGDDAKVAEAAEKLNKFFDADKATVEQQKAATEKNKPEAEAKENDGPSLPRELR
jgi:tetratricopeptide (TPR) repeat protein